jgi:polyhydroxyalkanoate synthase
MSEVVGQHTAETGSSRSPADIYHIADDVRLHRLRPATGDLYPVPIVLVPSLLSKWYVFDLHPARTMAGFLRDHLYDVWVVDWGKPYRKRPTPSFETYVDDYLAAAIDDITGAAGIDQVTVLGYSLGGVMSTVFTALYPDRVRNLITLTTPIDFHRTGLTAIWARYFPINPFVDFWGNIPGWWLRGAFTLAAGPRRMALMRTLRGDMDTQEGRAVVNEVRKWIRDGVPVAGEMYRTLVHDCYKHNMLIRQSLPIGGRTVDLGDIESALLTITASEDHLCPPKSAEALNRAVASEDETAISVPGGHLGAVIGPKAHHLLWTRIDDWLSERSGHHPADWYGGQP